MSAQAGDIWRKRLDGAAPDMELMQAHNPIYIPRNHQVEAALLEAESGNMVRFDALVDLLRTPFVQRDNMAGFEASPLQDEEVTQTFCGT
jgi:serine/tyrosine/threonine adenylyltransferase